MGASRASSKPASAVGGGSALAGVPARAPERAASNPNWHAFATRDQSPWTAMQESKPAIELGSARVHVDDAAGRAASQLSARAVTVGTDIYFGRGEWGSQAGPRLLRHELAHTRQVGRRVEPHAGLKVASAGDPAEREAERGHAGTPGLGSPNVAYRHPTAPSTVARKTRTEIFVGTSVGLPFGLSLTLVPPLTLEQFRQYTQEQADWYVEPSLTATDRDDLWRLLLLENEGSHILTGIGDLGVDQLRGVSLADLDALRTFCRGTDSSQHTLRIFDPDTLTLTQRIELGRTLAELEILVPGEVLELTVSQSQLETVRANGWMPVLHWYWGAFHPTLSRTFTPAPGSASGAEFQKLLDLIGVLGGSVAAVTAALTPLIGWLRNPHRFSLAALDQLKANLLDVTATRTVPRPLVLLLHTAHDDSSFQAKAAVFEELINTTRNNVLMIEGAESLGAITTRLPGIAATWGHPDAGGVPRISQVVVAGHGSPTGVELAGTGAPTVSSGHISYPSESLDSRHNRDATERLLDALFANMDHATARVLFSACLISSRPIGPGRSPAQIRRELGRVENFTDFVRQRADAAGMPATMPIFGGRASTTVPDRVINTGTGDVHPTYAFDPHAYDVVPNLYVQTGNEPEGVLRAAVEVGATDRVVAENLLNTRLRAGGSGWWAESVIALVGVALSTITRPGSGIDLRWVNELANVAETVFLSRWPDSFGKDVNSLVGALAPHRFRRAVVNAMLATATFTAPGDPATWKGRLITEQARLRFAPGAAARAGFMAALDATTLHADSISTWISTSLLSSHLPALLTVTGTPTLGQIRLALAWYSVAPRNPTIRRFLRAHVITSGAAPAFEPAFATAIEDAGRGEQDILEDFGLVGTTTVGGRSLPRRNTEFTGDADNDEAITLDPHQAEVIARTLAVRARPSFGRRTIVTLTRGTVVRVMGALHGWLAIELAGPPVQQGFVPPGSLRRR
ncbi:eCIS core domain-containing protein [Nannocystaceae bacterium ST9]